MAAKYALVTGGNRGIGLELSKQLVAANKPVLLACRSLEAGRAAAAQLTASHPNAKVEVLPLDSGSSSSIDALADAVKQQYDQQIDLLINNAGILVPSVWDQPTFEQTLAVNVAGPVHISQALLPLLSPGALIIMVSSGLGALANLSADMQEAVQGVASLADATSLPFKDSPMGTAPPGSGGMSPTYSVAKALLNRAVQLMAADEAFTQRGISVASTCPGWCRTDMGTSAADRSAEQGASSVLWPWRHWSADLNGSFTRDGEKQAW